MKTRYMVQFGIAIVFFSVSALISWYEGSNLIEDSFEWKYSAKFTNYFQGPVSSYDDILQIDFFVYAAKFYPVPVLIMVASFGYMLFLSVYIILKKRDIYPV
ncbi:YjdJ family protein [Bacillus multifaciens]|uniref:YjdJ family protein n=1 Tax=Bacillus multifaciens TaxID=3068506 RepID=UPI002740D0CB|nr:YjdJ family protein [Bacillus sp. WLY-B-L8]MDP7979011.1 YjdJ family protein [Bacillus sp. WLY-B-L8]